MAREYTVSFRGLSIVGAPTLIAMRPAANCALELLRMWIGQSGTTTAEQLQVEYGIQSPGSPTFVAATPARLKQGDPPSQIVGGTSLAAGTVGINASVEGGARTPWGADAFSNTAGWTWLPTPDETLVLSPGSAEAFYLRLPVTPSSLTLWAAGWTFKEIG